MAEDGERITLNGPYFSIKEPWVSNDFKKESVKHKEMQLPDFTVDIDDPNIRTSLNTDVLPHLLNYKVFTMVLAEKDQNKDHICGL